MALHLEHIAVGFNLKAHHGPLLEGLRLASKTGAHLDILYVVQGGQDPIAIRDTVEKVVMAHAGDDCPQFTVHTLTGKVPVALGQFCSDGNADLLVVGPRATTLRERFLTGGPAAQLARFIDIPVLLATGPGEGSFQKVLVPVDFSVPSTAALKTAVEWVHGQEGAQIHVAHVFGPQGAPLRIDQGAQVGRLVNIVSDELAHYMSSIDFGGVQHEAKLLTGRTHKAILNYADEIAADLIVIGVVGNNWLGEAIIGTTTARLIKAMKRPMLIVHPLGRGN